MKDKVSRIATHLADRVRTSKRPYSQLKWIVENCDWQYRATGDELWRAYFAAINILKRDGVENPKRKPLSKLNKQQRTKMRKHAKELAAIMQKVLNTPVVVSRSPIKTYSNGSTEICLQVHLDAWGYPHSWSNQSLSYEDLCEWGSLDPDERYLDAVRFAEGCKPQDQRIAENIDVIKADLESLI